MPQSRPYLIIAQSGRALAASAAAAGITTHVIDRFADLDTRTFTLSTRIIAGLESGLDTHQLMDIIADFSKTPLAGIVVGSGLESYPEVLDVLSSRWRLYGNNTEVVRRCKDPEQSTSLLVNLGIPHPETSIQSKASSNDRLLKQTGGAGGGHIRKYTNTDGIPTHYYIQEKLEGRSLSIIFLANGRNARVVGINETWSYAPHIYDYRYAGAVTLSNVGTELYASFEKAIQLLTHELHLVGLCGLDVIVDDTGQLYVLEINPRPTATFELHENNNSLFYAHIMACQGKLIVLPDQNQDCRGHEVIYAGSDLHVPQLKWPEWVVDCPRPGVRIATGEPICTIQAAAISPGDVRDRLAQRKASIYKQLGLQRVAA